MVFSIERIVDSRRKKKDATNESFFLFYKKMLSIHYRAFVLCGQSVQKLSRLTLTYFHRTMSSADNKTATKYDFDYFVIGGGSGGVRSSRIAAQHGAKVALAESNKLGGTCVNVGCVPKKLFCYASQFREQFHDAQAYGWPKVDFKLEDHQWTKFIESKNAEIKRLNDAYEKTQKDNNVQIIKGFASFKDQHTIVVDEKEYTAKYVLIAVGGEPVIPNIEGREHIITSDDAFFLEKLPKKIVIVGKICFFFEIVANRIRESLIS